ncbi:MAG: GNAT family N-acetyltransferase [Acidimicrobiia bacterium]|nr:GNAT family N-acetyltransferase [Acidimicrobiia bacterium]
MSGPGEPQLPQLAVSIETEPDPADVEALAVGLNEHSGAIVGTLGFRPLAVFARGKDGDLVGGAYGFVNWTWLQISLLWVAAEQRGKGLGSRLLEEIEVAAAARGCTRAHLDTFAFQAKPFYERHGYEVFATLDDYPPGHQRFFLVKGLGAEFGA